MIRMIQRRLIIPKGDTGSFSLPLKQSVEQGAIAVFAIFDPLTRTTIFSKTIDLVDGDEFFTIELEHEDTSNLEPANYLWDVTIYNPPIYDEENNLIGGTEVNSYFAPFKLPVCAIKEVAYHV